MRSWGFPTLGWGVGCPLRGWKGHTEFGGAAERRCLVFLLPWWLTRIPPLTPSTPARTNSVKTGLSSAHDHLHFSFFKDHFWDREMPPNRAPHSPAKQGDCPMLSPASPAKAISPEAQPQCWHCRVIWQDKIPKQSPCFASVSRADVVQQSGTKSALRNYGLSALFTRSFFHEIVSHNSNSPTLLATDH